MRNLDGRILFSATDLLRFMGCSHATLLDLEYMRGSSLVPREDSEDAALLQKQGNEHEAKHLANLKTAGRQIVEIARRDFVDDVASTKAALATGTDVIFQGALLSGNWGGWSDFLERVATPSVLGNFSYEVTDTKLKRRPHPKHVLQLVLYSDLLSEIQGLMPEFAHVELGGGERATLRLVDYSAYARQARTRLENFVATPTTTRPVPCSDCGLCRWEDSCKSVWKAEDSLFNVANISLTQVKKLEAADIKSMAMLATLEQPIRGMVEATRSRLVIQARLQDARKTGDPSYVLRQPETSKGFELLPAPQQGDIFYDIEGDPYYEGGLEYLHGIWFDGQFRTFWAHNHAAEAKALSDLLEFFRLRLSVYPAARIYHYAPYEITALRRLSTKYGIGEAFLDRLLREQRFVDLYAVVRGSLIGSEPNYSIKSMEAFYGLKREGEVKTAGGSVVAYENWCETGSQEILDEIADYNRVDCVSTEKLRDWLVAVRPAGCWPVFGLDAVEKEVEEDKEAQDLRDELADSELPAGLQKILFDLGMFHKREAKPAQWAVFDSVTKDEDDLIDELDALAGLEAVGSAKPVKRSMARTYRFPPQETKLREGRNATVPVPDGTPTTVTIDAMDRLAGEITIKVGLGKAHLLTDRLTLHPDWPLVTDVIASALRGVIADQCGPRNFTALSDLLGRVTPRLKGPVRKDILADADPVTGTIAAVAAMDGTILPIQGPPGTGKTYVTAHTILSLVKKGHRIAVTSNSHEAIRNVLIGCHLAIKNGTGVCDTEVQNIELVHKVSGDDDGYPDGFTGVTRVTKNDDLLLSSAQIVGGTAFLFSRPDFVQAFDWLFVDEAGQVGLANLVAMGRSARNIVLVGDPRQLPMVIQGAHPYPANLSCLEWLLGDHATVPPDRGIFLQISRRMHPEVCKYISEQVYEGRLQSFPDTAKQKVCGTSFPEAGAFWVSVPHEGNAQTSPEEISAMGAAARELLGGTWSDSDGNIRPMREADIIVVAPYNAQVNALRETLPPGIRVGTVDKFQGQEAPICLVSMTTSSIEEAPRGMEFLFSLNRINVAVSRAKALALLFGSDRLREAKCATIEHVKLVNTLSALDLVTASSKSRIKQ